MVRGEAWGIRWIRSAWLACLLLLCAAAASSAASAQAVKVGDLYLRLDEPSSGRATIAAPPEGQAFYINIISIPETVTVDGSSYLIVALDPDAFTESKNVKGFTVANDQTTFQLLDQSLYDATGTTLLRCPPGRATGYVVRAGTTAIAPGAFSGCRLLPQVSLPDEVTDIGERAFAGCPNLSGATGINFPTALKSIGKAAFQNCAKVTKAVLPEGIKELPDDVFNGCWSLKTLEGLDHVDRLGERVFAGCKELNKLTLSSNITELRAGLFSNCEALTALALPEGLTTIGDDVFNGCAALASINFPAALFSIGDRAFEGCKKLTELDLNEGLAYLGSETFKGCTGLTTLTLPEGVTDVPEGLFADCEALTSVAFAANTTDIGERAFQGCRRLAEVTIPEGVAAILEGTFYGCSELAALNLPDGLTRIEDEALYGCYKLKELTISYLTQELELGGSGVARVVIVCKMPVEREHSECKDLRELIYRSNPKVKTVVHHDELTWHPTLQVRGGQGPELTAQAHNEAAVRYVLGFPGEGEALPADYRFEAGDTPHEVTITAQADGCPDLVVDFEVEAKRVPKVEWYDEAGDEPQEMASGAFVQLNATVEENLPVTYHTVTTGEELSGNWARLPVWNTDGAQSVELEAHVAESPWSLETTVRRTFVVPMIPKATVAWDAAASPVLGGSKLPYRTARTTGRSIVYSTAEGEPIDNPSSYTFPAGLEGQEQRITIVAQALARTVPETPEGLTQDGDPQEFVFTVSALEPAVVTWNPARTTVSGSSKLSTAQCKASDGSTIDFYVDGSPIDLATWRFPPSQKDATQSVSVTAVAQGNQVYSLASEPVSVVFTVEKTPLPQVSLAWEPASRQVHSGDTLDLTSLKADELIVVTLKFKGQVIDPAEWHFPEVTDTEWLEVSATAAGDGETTRDRTISVTFTVTPKPEGINVVREVESGLFDGALYDLLGHPLSEPPEHGVYIQRGHLRVRE